MMQLSLFTPAPTPEAPIWLTGRDAREVAPFTHLIRAPDDPDRRDRATSLGGSHPQVKIDSFAQLRKRPRAELEAEIRALLEQAGPLTFQAIAVTLWDKTADIVFETVADDALWALVEAGVLEHTNAAPVRFRVREAA